MTETIPQPRTDAAADQNEDTAPSLQNRACSSAPRCASRRNAVRRGLSQPTSQVRAHRHTAPPGRQRRKKVSRPRSVAAWSIMGTAAGLTADLQPG